MPFSQLEIFLGRFAARRVLVFAVNQVAPLARSLLGSCKTTAPGAKHFGISEVRIPGFVRARRPVIRPTTNVCSSGDNRCTWFTIASISLLDIAFLLFNSGHFAEVRIILQSAVFKQNRRIQVLFQFEQASSVLRQFSFTPWLQPGGNGCLQSTEAFQRFSLAFQSCNARVNRWKRF